MDTLILFFMLATSWLSIYATKSENTAENETENTAMNESDKPGMDSINIFQKRIDLLVEYKSMMAEVLKEVQTNPETKRIDSLNIEGPKEAKQVIASIFERYSSFTIQVCFLACRARYQLVVESKSESEKNYKECLYFSKFTKWYNSQLSVKTFYDLEPKVKGYENAEFKIESVVKNVEILFTKLSSMEKVFESAEENGYGNVLSELNKRVDVSYLGLMETVEMKNEQIRGKDSINQDISPKQDENSSKNDISAQFLEQFFKFFGQTILDVENYWKGFFKEDERITEHSQLIKAEETANSSLQFTSNVVKTELNVEEINHQNIMLLIDTQVAYFSKSLSEEVVPETTERPWNVVVPSEGKMDFLHELTQETTALVEEETSIRSTLGLEEEKQDEYNMNKIEEDNKKGDDERYRNIDQNIIKEMKMGMNE